MTNHTTFDWRLWLQWVLATTLGWLIGSSFLPLELAAGLSIGVAQWLVLRPLYPRTVWWIPLSAAGWMLGWGISMAAIPPQAGFLIAGLVGLSMGSFQWLLLRRWVPQAGWWIIVSGLAWILALSGLTDALLAGLLAGMLTGIGLELLVRYSK